MMSVAPKRSYKHVFPACGIVLLFLISFLFPDNAYANQYYYKKQDNGVVYYTNIKTERKDYKKMASPWGTFRGTTKAQRKHVTSYKYKDNFDKHITNTARWYDLDPLLVKAIIKVESNFNPDAVSPAGAMGIMQLMPGTALDLGVKDVFDPVENIDGGVRYLSKLQTMFDNNIVLTLAGYNAGEEAVIKYGNKIPPYPETIDYVEKVYSHYDHLRNKPKKRSFDHMIAERFDNKPIVYSKTSAKQKKKASFIYVETLDGVRSNSKSANAPARTKTTTQASATTKKDVIQKPAEKVYGDSDRKAEKSVSLKTSMEAKHTVSLTDPNISQQINTHKKPDENVSGNIQKEIKIPDTVKNIDRLVAINKTEHKNAVKEKKGIQMSSENNGRYSVQIASFPKLSMAESMKRKLISNTIPAYIQKADIPDKGTWYRVKIGKFSTKEEAKEFGNELKTHNPAIDSFLVTMN